MKSLLSFFSGAKETAVDYNSTLLFKGKYGPSVLPGHKAPDVSWV